MIQPGDFYYDRKKGKKNGKEMMPLEQPTSLRMEPLIPIKYDARIHCGGETKWGECIYTYTYINYGKKE